MNRRSARLRVAAAQLDCRVGDVGGNTAKHLDLVGQAGRAGVDLVVFPELSLTGYDLDLIETDPRATFDSEDRRLRPLADAATRHNVTILAGAAVTAPPGRMLAALAFHPEAALPTLHAKTHLHGRENELFLAGDGPSILEVDGWRVAVAVCFDAAIPQHASLSRSLGADIYAVTALYTVGQEQRLDDHMATRSRDNDMTVVLGQHVGDTGAGHACGRAGVWNREGAAVVQLNERNEGIAAVDITATGATPA